MEDTPEVSFASALSKPFTPPKLILRPAATMRKSYVNVSPVAVVTVLEDGVKDWTLAGMCATSFGITWLSGLTKSSFLPRPDPMRVQPGWSKLY